MAQQTTATLVANFEDGRVVLDVENRSKDLITIVIHPRYFTVELLDERGQFVRGVEPELGTPTKKDFVDVPAGGRVASVIVLDVRREDRTTTVGATSFDEIPQNTQLRATYKPDALVPNLPSGQRRSFFRGPLQSERVDLR